TCWDPILGDLNGTPLLTGEMGFDGYIESYMTWADAHGVGYLAWTWDTWGCDGGQALISDYSGTPCSPYGTGYQQHLADLTPTQLVFTTEPGGGKAGISWATQPTVTIENAAATPVASDTNTIPLTIPSGPGSGKVALAGCSATTNGGVAVFQGCQI